MIYRLHVVVVAVAEGESILEADSAFAGSAGARHGQWCGGVRWRAWKFHNIKQRRCGSYFVLRAVFPLAYQHVPLIVY